MSIQPIGIEQKKRYNAVIHHPLQSFEWGQFREKTGAKVIRRGLFEKDTIVGGFQLTIHKIPKTNWNIGYLPRGEYPTRVVVEELRQIGLREHCIFIQMEPNVLKNNAQDLGVLGLVPAAHPLFTKYTFVLDLTQSEDELLKKMHHKARYNIRVAQKHNVEIVQDNSKEAFLAYWKLMEDTTIRQKFYAHTKHYHELQWEYLNAKADKDNVLTAHLFQARYQNKILAAWILFVCEDVLYYPYGASSNENREVMASNLMMWEAIRYGRRLGLKQFDMWGALGPNPDPKDSWFGFHTFKQRYGSELVEFIGSYDLVINPVLYQGFKLTDKLRWLILRLRK